MKKVLILIFFLFSFAAFPQVTFQKAYKGIPLGEQVSTFSAQQTSDGGYVAGCWSYATGMLFDMVLIKTDSNGDTIWTRTYDSGGEDMCRAVHQTSDRGYILTGWTVGGFCLLKTDSSGSFQWAKNYLMSGGGEGNFVIQTTDGGYAASGSESPFNTIDALLIKTDTGGNLQWAKTYGGTASDGSKSVRQTLDGGYIIAGTTLSFGSGAGDILIIKTDSSGAVSWAKTYGTSADESGYYVEQTADSGYVIVGADNNSPQSSYLIKTDGGGNLIWSKMFGYTEAFCVHETADGGYVMIDRGLGMGLIKTDNAGNMMWSKYYPEIAEGNSVNLASDGGFLLAGDVADSVNNFSKLFLVKTDSLGNSGCVNNGVHTVSVPSLQVTSPSLTVATINPPVSPRNVTVGGGFIPQTICVVGIDEASNAESSIYIYPNPATERFTIDNSQFPIESIEIYDAIGEKVFSTNVPPFSSWRRDLRDEVINVSSLSSGIYFVQLKTSEGYKTQKLIVQH